ncbi:MAG: GIY-YIG nuclease family protein [Patescibacteria group bacterium]
MADNYYVYVYIDPRNYEEFYYGKGKGNRKVAHLYDEKDTEKTKIIKAIQKEGLEPIIKVVAKGLSESDAFLIEKTLIWKLGKNLSNISSGHFSDKFRPHNSYHLNLNSFDFANGIFYVNVGEGETRAWRDCQNFGFLAAGQGTKWSEPLKTLNIGDIVVAYLKRKGYVGIGRVVEKAKRVLDFKFDGKSLKTQTLDSTDLFKNSDNENTEFLVKIDWIKSVPTNEAKWKNNSGLFTTQLIKASLENQVKTINFLEKEFHVNFTDIMND